MENMRRHGGKLHGNLFVNLRCARSPAADVDDLAGEDMGCDSLKHSGSCMILHG